MPILPGPYAANVLFQVCAVDEADPEGRRALWVASGTGGLREAWLADLDDVENTRVLVATGYRMGRPVWHADSGRFVIAHKQDSETERLIVQAINPDLPEGPHSFATFDLGASPLGDAYHCVVRPGADEGGAAPAPVQVVSGISLYEVDLDAAGQFGLIELAASLIENFPAADADGVDPDGTDASARILTAAEGRAQAGTTRAAQPQIGTRDQLVTGLDVRRVAVLPGGDQGERLIALVRNANGSGSLRRSLEPSPFRLDALSTEVATLLAPNQAVCSWDGILAALVENGRLYTLDVETAARALVAALDPAATGEGADALYMAVAEAAAAPLTYAFRWRAADQPGDDGAADPTPLVAPAETFTIDASPDHSPAVLQTGVVAPGVRSLRSTWDNGGTYDERVYRIYSAPMTLTGGFHVFWVGSVGPTLVPDLIVYGTTSDRGVYVSPGGTVRYRTTSTQWTLSGFADCHDGALHVVHIHSHGTQTDVTIDGGTTQTAGSAVPMLSTFGWGVNNAYTGVGGGSTHYPQSCEFAVLSGDASAAEVQAWRDHIASAYGLAA